MKFLWGRRGAGEGGGAGAGGAGGDVRGKRVPAAAAPATRNTTIHHLDITGARCARNARDKRTVTLPSGRLAACYALSTTFTFVVARGSGAWLPHSNESEGFH